MVGQGSRRTTYAGDDTSGTEGSPVELSGSATDPDGDSLTTSWSYTANADPAVSIDPPADGTEVAVGATVAVAASFTDAGGNDTHTCSIDWGDGTVEAGTLAGGDCTGSHAYATDGGYAVTVTVSDDDGGSAPTRSG